MADRPAIFVGRGSSDFELLLALANRHGLITGATGTGKTVTLRVLAEGFSAAGVPVFMADVKGDLAGICKPGGDNPKVAERAQKLGIQGYATEGMPTCFWDLLGEQGHPVRAAVSEMGPVLMARLLELNDTQAGVLNLAFKYADDNGLLLLDLKDLRALLTHIADNAKELTVKYGNVAAASVGAIQRSLLTLETQGGDKFFGEPALDLNDLMRKDGRGRGLISVLAADKLMMRPRLYATFLLWLLSELFEGLPEVGDPDQPKLVFFFDEAHLLFNDSPKALIDRVEQVVRLIRSKGVGVFFVTQNPLDVPETVLGQLGNRVQHALRAFTPKDQKAVRAAAETFRANPKLDTAAAILELAVGEALVSLLDAKGTPAMVDRGLIAPPRSRLGPIEPAERQAVMKLSPVAGKYDQAVDRDSAYEQLTQRLTEPAAPQTADAGGGQSSGGNWTSRIGLPWGTGQSAPPAPAPGGRQAQRPAAPARGRETVVEAVVKSVARNVAGQIGRQIGAQIVRGVLGSILKR